MSSKDKLLYFIVAVVFPVSIINNWETFSNLEKRGSLAGNRKLS